MKKRFIIRRQSQKVFLGIKTKLVFEITREIEDNFSCGFTIFDTFFEVKDTLVICFLAEVCSELTRRRFRVDLKKEVT